MTINLITPIFYEKNWYDLAGIIQSNKRIIQDRFIYKIDKFGNGKPNSISEFFVKEDGKLYRWNDIDKSWKIAPIFVENVYFYVIETNIPLAKKEMEDIKEEWTTKIELASDFNQEVILDNKNVLPVFYEQKYFDKENEIFEEKIISKKYIYISENMEEGFYKNLKVYSVNKNGLLAKSTDENVLLPINTGTYYFYVTFDKDLIKEDRFPLMQKEMFQEITIKKDKTQKVRLIWQAEYICNEISKKIISRNKWSKRKPNFNGMEYHFDYSTIAIHHSGDDLVHPLRTRTPKDIEKEHFEKNGWDDIGYHFLVDAAGKIYEGRRLYFKGSHIGNANSHKIGILVIGDFEPQFYDIHDETPTNAQISSVCNLVLLLKKYFPLEILGGHRDWGKSVCPGENLYKLLPEIRTKTKLKEPKK